MGKEIQWLLAEKYHNTLTQAFHRDVQRLKQGEPLDYVIGFTEFLGCKIDLSKKPLIPRPETEYWLGKVLQEIPPAKKVRVLDVFAGSGCIGIAVAKKMKNTTVVFAEKSNNALEQIKINAKVNKLSPKRYTIQKSDIFENVEGVFDIIFANPPYIPTARKSKIQASVLRHEPKKALFGGKDGLFFIRKFLLQARSHVQAGSVIAMEFDSIQKNELKRLLKKLGYEQSNFHRDQYGKWRWVQIVL